MSNYQGLEPQQLVKKLANGYLYKILHLNAKDEKTGAPLVVYIRQATQQIYVLDLVSFVCEFQAINADGLSNYCIAL